MTPKTLTQKQMKSLEIHHRTNHCVSIKEIQVMASMGIFDSMLASCQPPVCALCMFGCAHKKPWRVKGKEKHAIRSESETDAGDDTSLEALTSSTPGIIPQMSGFLTSDRFWAATFFVNHATSYMYTHLQRGQTLIKSIGAKAAYEQMAETSGIRVKKFHTDSGFFAEEGFKSDVWDNNQTIRYCRVGAHFQNVISEAAIKQLTEKARTMMIRENHRWPDVIQPFLWPSVLKQVEFNLNTLRLGKSGKSRAKTFRALHKKITIRHYHTFGCQVYVLDAQLQGASFIPKWDTGVRVGAYFGRSPIHSVNISLILNLSTRHISPQFHVMFDKTFSTVPSLKNRSVPASWKFICKNNGELAMKNISIWQIYGANLSRKVASNSTSKRTQLTKHINSQKMIH